MEELYDAIHSFKVKYQGIGLSVNETKQLKSEDQVLYIELRYYESLLESSLKILDTFEDFLQSVDVVKE
jgi:hypothetical protein